MVVAVGGLFDYSVTPGPSFWESELIKSRNLLVTSSKKINGGGGGGWPV